MTPIFLITVASALFFAAIFALLIRRASEGEGRSGCAPDSVNSIDPARYRVMATLLAPEEFEYLRSQRNADRGLERKFRAERRRIFRLYLKSLSRDFHKTCAALRMTMVHSEVDRSELAAELMRQQLRFRTGLLVVRFQLALDAMGVGQVQPGRLLGAFDVLGTQLRALTPASVRAAA